MTLTVAILTLLGTLASLAFWLMKRQAARADDPTTQRTNETERVDGAIAQGPSGVDEVNRLVAGHVSAADGSGVQRGVVGVPGGQAKSPGDSSGPVDPMGFGGIDELNRRLPGATGPDAGNTSRSGI